MCPLDMDFSTNVSILSTEQNFTLELLSVYDLSLLRKCLVWLETSTAVIALAVNILVITALIGNNASCRGYFHGLLNLSLAQCFLSIASLTSAVSSLLILDYNYSPFTSKDFWLRSVLHNISLAIFSGLCVTGASALSWTHWWSLNIWMNHTEMPTGYRVVKVMFYVLWLTTIMFATWLNLLNTWAIGLTTTVAENDEGTVRPCLRIYSMTMFVSAGLLLFSNVTSIPAVTGHMTSRAVQSNHQPDCRDADCVCSDSEADDMSNSIDHRPGATSITSPQSNKETDQQCLKNPEIPTIVTFSDDDKENEKQNSSATENEINSFNKVNNLRPYTGENILSSGPSTDALPTVCNLSIYSADISANSATEYLADSALKLSVERLHQRLQQLNDSRPIPPPDPESPQSSFSTSITVERKRTKKKRKPPSKKFKRVKRIQLERPNRVQVSVLLSFAFFYMPPWLLLVVAIYIPHHATNLLPILRLLINVINSINPLLQGFRHPRFAIKLARTWRKIYPVHNNFSQNNLNLTRCQN